MVSGDRYYIMKITHDHLIVKTEAMFLSSSND
jgi:hypothetical protein